MFTLNANQVKKFKSWFTEITSDILEAQQALFGESAPTHPYYGGIGGGITYSFTPTNLGVIVEVTEHHTKKKLDLTDYESW